MKTTPGLVLAVFFTCLALLWAGCGPLIQLGAPEVRPNAALQLHRQPSGNYVLTADEGGTQPIFIGTRPTNIDWENPIGQRQGKKTLIVDPGPADRYFIGMLNQEGDTVIVSDTRIPLEGAINFRDIGGIPTRDGRFVRWGMVYRSDKLSGLSDEDMAYLNSLDLATVYDFRSEKEVAEAPDELPSGDIDYIHAPIYFDVEDTAGIRAQILSGSMTPDETANILIEGNRLFATDMAPRFQPFIDCLLEGKGPIVYHCTSGKDRTGFATMLLLSALNVGKDTIIQDYMLSNYYRHELNNERLRKLRYAQIIKRKLDVNTLTPLMVVDRRYIESAYTAIEEKFGSVEAFLEEEYGLTPAKRAQLIEMYTYGPAVVVEGEFIEEQEGQLETPTEDSIDESKAKPAQDTLPKPLSDNTDLKKEPESKPADSHGKG